jgi:hypothetical protein
MARKTVRARSLGRMARINYQWPKRLGILSAM